MLYGDFGFSPISSVPTPLWHPPRTEEFLFSRFSPYSTTFSKQVVRRFWLFTHFLRTSTSLAPTTYGGISNSPFLSVLHHLHQTSCTEILAFLSFPPYQHLHNTHHVRRNPSFPNSLRTPPPTPNKLYGGIRLFSHFLRTSTSITPTTYGGIPLFPILSVLHHLHQTSCTEILAFHSFPPYPHHPDTHHVRRNF